MMTKKARIALLEQQIKDLESRVRMLEVGQRVAPFVPPSPYPWTQPWTRTTGPSDAVDLTPRQVDGVRCGTSVMRNGHEEPAILGP